MRQPDMLIYRGPVNVLKGEMGVRLNGRRKFSPSHRNRGGKGSCSEQTTADMQDQFSWYEELHHLGMSAEGERMK